MWILNAARIGRFARRETVCSVVACGVVFGFVGIVLWDQMWLLQSVRSESRQGFVLWIVVESDALFHFMLLRCPIVSGRIYSLVEPFVTLFARERCFGGTVRDHSDCRIKTLSEFCYFVFRTKQSNMQTSFTNWRVWKWSNRDHRRAERRRDLARMLIISSLPPLKNVWNLHAKDESWAMKVFWLLKSALRFAVNRSRRVNSLFFICLAQFSFVFSCFWSCFAFTLRNRFCDGRCSRYSHSNDRILFVGSPRWDRQYHSSAMCCGRHSAVQTKDWLCVGVSRRRLQHERIFGSRAVQRSSAVVFCADKSVGRQTFVPFGVFEIGVVCDGGSNDEICQLAIRQTFSWPSNWGLHSSRLGLQTLFCI